MAESEAIQKEILETNFEFQGNGKETVVNWTLGKQIGYGAFSKVYSGKFKILDKDVDVAVKVINIHSSKDEKILKAIRKETDALKKLSHERIIVYYGISQQEFDCFIFMEYMSYGTLRNLIVIREVLSDDKICLYTKQLIEGIKYLHSNRILHRDIKSGNILLNDENSVKLSDFGVSKIFEELSKATTTSVGTLRYMAPEMFHRNGYSYPVDIWALGCVVLEMFTGDYPFTLCSEQQQVMCALIVEKKSPLDLVSHRLPGYANTFLTKIFKIDPNKRPSCDELHIDSRFFKGDLDRLHQMFSHCKKNPEHKEFIPISRFSKANLPEEFRDIDLYELIKASSDLTVFLKSRGVSKKRPEFWPNTHQRYPFNCLEAEIEIEILIHSPSRYGSGEISSIVKYTDGCGTDESGRTYDIVTKNKLKTEYKTCPCSFHEYSPNPHNVWWEIFILTAVHVVFDDNEAFVTHCELFFDEDDGSSSQVILKQLSMSYRNIEEDRCLLKYVTCNETKGNKLYQLGQHRNNAREKILRKFKDSKFMFMVSHPHGCAKQVSMGKLNENTKCGEINANVGLSKLSYSMATCAGCSGAAVHCIGLNHQHAHSRTKFNENDSGVGLLFK